MSVFNKAMQGIVVSCLFSTVVLAAPVPVNDAPVDADPWFDITVLRASVREDLTLRSFDRVENCEKVSDEWVNYGRAGRRHEEAFDCSTFIGHELNAIAFKRLPLWTFENGQLTSSHQLDTPIVEVYTVVPLDRLAHADFLGFSESSMGGGVNLFWDLSPNGPEREAGHVRLKDGRFGIIHRWIAAFEETGRAEEGVLRYLPFKPVLVRMDGDTELRYWDRLIGVGLLKDYVISNHYYDEASHRYRVGKPNSYDRSAELLR